MRTEKIYNSWLQTFSSFEEWITEECKEPDNVKRALREWYKEAWTGSSNKQQHIERLAFYIAKYSTKLDKILS